MTRPVQSGRCGAFALALALIPAIPNPAQPQNLDEKVSRIKLLGVNAAIGGITAGVSQAARGRSFWKGMLNGSAGGATVYFGKCLIGQKTTAGDWFGRGTVMLGSSAVANASAGRPILQQLVAPLGPVRLYRDNKTGRQRIKLDFSTTVVALYLATRRGTSFQRGMSLEHGALVFRDASKQRDTEAAGVVILGDPAFPERAFAHELTHVAQQDYVATAWEDPLEEWLFRRLPGGKSVTKYVHIGVLNPLWVALGATIDYRDQPWEKEARSFANGC